MKIKWLNSSQTLLMIDNRIINLALSTQTVLNEELGAESGIPHVTFYFGVPIGNDLHPDDNVPASPDETADSWWITYGEEKAEQLREFFGFK
ncbi:MAG: hypothetical protein ACRC2V_18845 [Xenococcaceae cyanobacterium]